MVDKKDIPDYYIGEVYGYEARKVIEDFNLSYNTGTVVTYLLRAGKKKYVNNDELESLEKDLLKSIAHLKFEVERIQNKKKGG